MNKLYNKKGKVHPSPSPPSVADPLALLPATVLALAISLSPEDQEVLAYLISCTKNSGGCATNQRGPTTTKSNRAPATGPSQVTSITCIESHNSNVDNTYGGHKAHQKHNRVGVEAGGPQSHHPPTFQCDCFRCYMSFWARWDASPNRQLIHEILEAYEERLVEKKRSRNSKVKKERRKANKSSGDHLGFGELGHGDKKEVEEGPQVVDAGVVAAEVISGGESGDDEGCEVGVDRGTMRRLVSSIGDKIWGLWN
ncbi:hypothetical protein TB2_023774 [Malus domestica]|uniref:uncharacterized protein LOC126610427 n=1 Tax=Malus sylvestris TaxID=3752 RepID=UPI0010AA3654|nr:uncharacterized protein LOC103425996 [Malus domestica]XP_050134432.1 uncharacterized protein LOC126610427 [Malus sylvestris]